MTQPSASSASVTACPSSARGHALGPSPRRLGRPRRCGGSRAPVAEVLRRRRRRPCRRSPRNGSAPGVERGDALLVGGVVAPPARPAGLARPARQADRREGLVVERLEGPASPPAPVAARSRVRAPGRARPGRARWAAACPAGWPAPGSSRRLNSTIECTTDCGCTTTSMRSNGQVEEQVRLDHLEALVDQGRGVGGDHRAHVPGGVGERLLRGDVGQLGPRLRPRNGPPLAVSTSRRTSSARPPRRHWASAECSESTGTIWPGAAAALTSGPPAMSDSLLASASVLPGGERGQGRAQPDRPRHAR